MVVYRHKVKALYISDLHLGSQYSQCRSLLDFLSRYEYEELYLLGDIFDCDQLKRRRKWTSCYTMFMNHILNDKNKVKIFYCPGNHDSFMRSYDGLSINQIEVLDEIILDRGDRKILMMHGDKLESHVKISRLLYKIGARLYPTVQMISSWFDRWSLKENLAKEIKYKTKQCMSYITKYEDRAAEHARNKGCTTIITGHIHFPKMTKIEDIEYFNTGDWVENCSAIVEDLEGNFGIKYYK